MAKKSDDQLLAEAQDAWEQGHAIFVNMKTQFLSLAKSDKPTFPKPWPSSSVANEIRSAYQRLQRALRQIEHLDDELDSQTVRPWLFGKFPLEDYSDPLYSFGIYSDLWQHVVQTGIPDDFFKPMLTNAKGWRDRFNALAKQLSTAPSAEAKTAAKKMKKTPRKPASGRKRGRPGGSTPKVSKRLRTIEKLLHKHPTFDEDDLLAELQKDEPELTVGAFKKFLRDYPQSLALPDK